MDKKTFIGVASYVFLVVGILHLLRIINQWSASVGELAIPMWVSWVVVICLGYLAWFGFGFSKK